MDYVDYVVDFHADLRELPIDENGTMQVDMIVLVACGKGKLRVELNGMEYMLRKNEILVCFPNTLIDNCMLSPDFEGAVLCLSQNSVLDQCLDCDLWDKVFRLKEHPVICVREENLHLFRLYGDILQKKTRERAETPYHRKIILSIVKTVLYELLSNVDEGGSYGKGLVNQRGVLFRRFVELLSTSRVKQRSVTWYADQLCISPKYLSTVCKQVSGKTAFDWINEYVEADIRYWLKSSTKSIKEIANLLNFPNLSFFGKYCRTRCGMSPTELRKQLRGQQPGSR